MQPPPPLNDPAISDPVLNDSPRSVPPLPAGNPQKSTSAADRALPTGAQLPPAPAPRASLPPVQPPTLPHAEPPVPGHQPAPEHQPAASRSVTPATQPTVNEALSTRAIQPKPKPAPVSLSKSAQPAATVKKATVAAISSPNKKDSRWRTDESADDSKSNESLVDLEPVRRSVPAWLISMIIHISLLLLLALWTTPLGQGISRVVLEFGEATEISDVELEVFSLESSDSQFETDDSDAEIPVEMDMEVLIDAVEITEPADIVPVDLGAAATELTVKPMFSGRSGAMKSALLAMYGGNQETIDAVERGLRWLARNQEKAGSWSMRGPFDDGSYSENRIAATAMALLAFQGDGNTHLDGPYSTVVAKGLRYLLKKQSRRDGFFAREAPGHEKSYAQAQATIAICELYGMTKDSSLRPAAQAAVDYAVKAQSSQGGWRYEPRQDSDLSVTGWYVMALSSAQSAGLDVEPSTLSVIMGYLERVSVYDGAGYVYQRGRPATPAMTAEGLLCRQYLGWGRNEEAMGLGINALVADWPINYSEMNVYYWYYATQAIHHYGGKDWEVWNGKMKVELPKNQTKRGRESGSWSPQADEWGQNAGRLFTTCLSIYCLEVYYRHLPLYKSTGH